MRKSALLGALALLGLAACSSGSESYSPMTTGVGFGDYQRYLQEREAARPASGTPYSVPPEVSRATAIVPPASMPVNAPSTLDAVPVRYAPAPVQATPVQAPPIQTAPVRAAPARAAPASQITTQTLAAPVIAPERPAPQVSPQVSPQAAAPQPRVEQPTARPASGTATSASVTTVRAGTGFGTTPAFDAGPPPRTGVSDEQDFEAVSSRESIESDRERIARQREQYQVIEVSSVPGRTDSGGPNIVAYALSTSHAPGSTVYRRINPLRWSRWESACLQFRNQDAAQQAFLENGGPDRDPGYLDPDGDGYACWWDPTPLRTAMAAAN